MHPSDLEDRHIAAGTARRRPADQDPDRRRPRRVYGVGSEPDPRWTLANERTFLAWIRTAVSLMAAGVVLEALDAPVEPHMRSAAAALLLGLAAMCASQAWWGWMRYERAMRTGAPLPGALAAGPLGVGVLIIGLLLLAGLVVA